MFDIQISMPKGRMLLKFVVVIRDRSLFMAGGSGSKVGGIE